MGSASPAVRRLDQSPYQFQWGGSGGQLQQLQHLAWTMQREVMRHDGFVKELTMDHNGLVMVVVFGVPPCCTWLQDPVLCGCEAGFRIRPLLTST
jgi:hypothetical protein